MRSVREEWGVPYEKRFVAGRLDKAKDRLEPLATDFQSFVTMPPTACGIAVCHAIRESAATKVAFPPLAGLETDVTALGQQFG